MLRSHSLPLCLFALLLAPGLASAQDFDTAGEAQMLARINAMRAAQNRAPLARHPSLDAAARGHTADMARQQALTHVSETSGTPADRVRAAGVSADSVSENVALHRSAASAHEALIGSDAHRGNMLDGDMTHIGLAALPTEAGVYVTQVFAQIVPEAEAEAEPAPPAPAPPAEAQQAEAAPPPPPSPPSGGDAAPEATDDPAPGGGTLAVQPGSNGTVVVHRNDQGRVLAYWVFGSGRWWYYPFPPGARPGQRLQVDPSVQGPPPGFADGRPAPPDHPAVRAPGAATQAPPPQQAQARPIPPERGGGAGVTIAPFRGRIEVRPGAPFYGTPPPPMGGRPTPGWRRAYRGWLRQYRRWQRRQERLRRRAL